jgi:biotin carboxyl carrier protein
MSRFKQVRKIVVRTTLIAGIAAGAWYGYRALRDLRQTQEQIATTKVRRGDVIVRSYARGELRAVRSTTLTAPNLFGTVQVTRLAPLGSFAREKDLVVEFDDSEVNSRVEEKQLEIDQLDEQIKKNTADLEMRNNQDQVDLLSARYAVRRAELEVKRNELLSPIDAKKNELTLKEANQRLKQLESDIKSRQLQAQAQIAVLREQKNKSVLELSREKQRLSQVRLLSPMSGLVAMRQNRTGFMFPGMQIPDIREGDQVQPGMPVADILDLSEMEVIAKVGELDRANLKEGQEASLELDALPDKKLHGSIKSMSGTASANVFSFDPAKKFDVVFGIDMRELLRALGAKPDQIQKILATAEQNRRKPGVSAPNPFLAGGTSGGPPMMVMTAGPGGAGQAPAGQGPTGQAPAGMTPPMQPGGDQAPGGMRRMNVPGGAAAMTPEMQQKIREIAQKELAGKNPQDLTPEQRQQLQSKIQQALAGMARSAGPGPGGNVPGAGPAAPAGQNVPFGAPGQGGPQQVMIAGGPRAGGQPMMFSAAAQKFSETDLANAKLPPPPEQDTQFDVLLRPGLLADVEIIVDKVPNAIYVPNQAVFEKEGKPVVYVKAGGVFEPRTIKPLKRSESVMIVAEGVQPGDVIALTDPTAKKSDQKSEKQRGGGAMGALPGGGK